MIDEGGSCRKVGGMRAPGTLRYCWLAALAFGTACAPRDSTPQTDTTTDSTAVVTETTSPPADWVSELGEVLVVPADSDGTAMVLFPDSPSAGVIASRALTLLATEGDTTTTRATLVVADSQICGEAPTIRFRDSVATPWSVGLLGARVTPLRTDSLGGTVARDSLRLTVELTRLASSIPMAAGSRFKGLPFSVLSARQFQEEGMSIVVTHLVRRLAQEAAPLEEHTLLIAEADSSRAQQREWRLVFHQRSEGSEETAEQYELLSAVRSQGRTLLLIARHRDAQSVYEVLQRGATGWRSRWHRILSC